MLPSHTGLDTVVMSFVWDRRCELIHRDSQDFVSKIRVGSSSYQLNGPTYPIQFLSNFVQHYEVRYLPDSESTRLRTEFPNAVYQQIKGKVMTATCVGCIPRSSPFVAYK